MMIGILKKVVSNIKQNHFIRPCKVTKHFSEAVYPINFLFPIHIRLVSQNRKHKSINLANYSLFGYDKCSI